MRVLLVDDDPLALTLLRSQLTVLGIAAVETCSRATDALHALQSAQPRFDLLFLDLNMPDMDGVELLRHLAQQQFAGRLVLVSGEDPRVLESVAALARAHRLRVPGSLRKPVSLDQLERVIERSAQPDPGTVRPDTHRTFDPDSLRAALANGELFNQYQPQVDLATGQVVAFEALVRWQHPEAGLVMPAQFVPVAENNGLSGALTRQVLARALDDAQRWAGTGRDLRLSINVSMNDLVALDLPDEIARTAAAAGVPAARLTLEITEGQAMRDPRVLLDIATRLRLKRIGLSIDDFGTGYSSLAQLRDVPFDELKLDRGFVRGAGGTAALRTMLEANLDMARQLGLRTVAEGLESRDDWDCLRELGSDLGQGYLIARPMTAAQVPDWIRQWQARRDDSGGI